MMLLRLVVSLVLFVLLSVACEDAERESPPRNPLSDTTTPNPTVIVTPAALVSSATATVPRRGAQDPPNSTGVPDDRDLEFFIGNALELMAEWLGIPVTDLRVFSAEALVWPNPCIGINQPGVFCAQVLTPGFRIELRDSFDNVHGVHGTTLGEIRWRGESVISGTVVAIESSMITIAADAGQHVLSIVPGTNFGRPGAEIGVGLLKEGLAVVTGFDNSPTGAGGLVPAWLVVVETP
jgi:hypothetical protein